MRTRRLIGCRGLLLALAAIALMAGPASAITYNLFAGPGTMTMPDGTNIPVWGYGLDVASGGDGTTVSVPGPELTVPFGDTNLTINLRNALPAPNVTSLVIPGQTIAMTPKWDDGATGSRTAGNYTARVMSFTTEAPNGGSATYAYTGVKPGTYIYQSGTNPAVQVQMGLYGVMVRDAANKQAYGASTAYDATATLVFHQFDPAFNAAVVGGTYTSALHPAFKHFLINGRGYPSFVTTPIAGGNVNKKTLLRFVNAGVQTYEPLLYGPDMSLVAENSYPLDVPRPTYVLELPAQATMDAILTPTATGRLALFDRRLNLNTPEGGTSTAVTARPRGMLTYLAIRP